MASSPLREPRDDNVIELLRHTPAVQTAIAERNATVALRRRVAISEIRRLDREAAKKFPVLDDAVKTAMAGAKDAEIALRAAQNRLNQEIGAKQTASYAYSAARDRLEHELRETAGAAVQTFCTDMIDEAETTRKALRWSDERVTHPVTRKIRSIHNTNMASIRARLAAIRAATEDAREIAISEADPVAVAEKVAALRAGLPAVGDQLIEKTE